MILKDIYLNPDLVEYNGKKEMIDKFRYQSRSVCGFLERKLGKLKFKTPHFKRVCFLGKSVPTGRCFINSCNVLEVDIMFDEKAYLDACTENSVKKINEFFIGMLIDGLNQVKEYGDDADDALPIDFLMTSLDEFRQLGYINEWVSKTKKLRFNRTALLKGSLTLDDFSLRFQMIEKNEIIFDQEILRTQPDEIFFMPALGGDIIETGHWIKVIDKHKLTIFEIDTCQDPVLQSLSAPDIHPSRTT